MSNNEQSSERIPLPDEDWHASTSFYVRKDTTVRAVYNPDYGVSLYINGFGGSVSLTVSPASWRLITETVESVLPNKIEVAS